MPTLLEILSSELDKHLEHNPSKDVPYHNNQHMAKVWKLAQFMWKIEKTDVDLHLGEQWSEIALMLAARLHDWGHSAGKEKDEVNIHVAKMKAKLIMNSLSVDVPKRVQEVVLEAIACTQFPFVIDPRNRLEEVLRDADLLYTACMDDPVIVMEHLRAEMEVAYGRKITYAEMCKGQKAFLESARLYTSTGEHKWSLFAKPFFNKLEQYAKERQKCSSKK